MSSPPPVAVVRPVPLSIARCEVTWIAREPIDADRARAQHAGYVQTLRACGVVVVELPEDPDHPDSVFVEDLLIDLGDVRVLTAPGAPSRRGERAGVRAAFQPGGPLADWGPLVEMPESLRLDGGDVLRTRDGVFVGVSSRTDRDAIAWLDSVTSARVVPVPVAGALHLKTAVSALSEDLLILLFPTGCPRTAAAARRWGIEVVEVAIDELAKAEAGLTCMSVLLGADFVLNLDEVARPLDHRFAE